MRDRSNSLPLSGLTGRDQYLASLALAASIALLDRAPNDNWQASAKTEMESLLAGMVTDPAALKTSRRKETGSSAALGARPLMRRRITNAPRGF
jgi:hypothetical protein